MKVLIVSGNDFIASYFAERFYREGYDIHLVSKNNNKNIKVKHKLHEAHIEDDTCEYIFLDNDFSIVIYIPDFCSEKNEMNRLSNLLKYSNKYRVEKFIYLSSTEIYEINDGKLITEKDPISLKEDKQINLHLYEECCRVYDENSYMNVVCLRMSKIYGPESNLNYMNHPIAKFINEYNSIEMISSDHICELEKSDDYIYIGDAVDAVYKASKSDVSNILNISSNNIFSNEKAREELNWSIKYTLKDGLEKTIKCKAKNEKKLKDKIKSIIVKENKSKSKVRPYIENTVLLILITIVQLYMQKRNLNINIDLNIIYIFVMGIVYGSSQSIISVVAASALSMFLRIENGENLIQIIYDTNTIFQSIWYIFFGIIMGYIIDKNNNNEQQYEKQIASINEKFDFINNLYEENRATRKELENQIVNQENSLGKLFTVTEKLNVLYPETIFDAAVEAVSEIMGTDGVSIYLLPKGQAYLRLIAQCGDNEIKKSINLLEHEKMKDKILNNKIFINKHFYDDLPTMVAPIFIDNEIKGVICMSNMKFEDVTLYKENLLTIVSKLISSALLRAYTYEEAILNEKYIENTEILREEYFKKIIEEKEEKGNLENNMLLKVIDGHYNLVRKYTRSVDSIGINKDGTLFILISNTNNDEIIHVMNRLESCGVKTEIKDFKVILNENNYVEEHKCS